MVIVIVALWSCAKEPSTNVKQKQMTTVNVMSTYWLIKKHLDFHILLNYKIGNNAT